MIAEKREPIIVNCGKCSHEWAIGFAPISAETFGKLKASCPVCRSKRVLMGEVPKPTADGDYIGWLANGDTGVSSKTIWSVMTGRAIGGDLGWRYYSVPLDPSDFGRCYRLLKIMPSWRERLPEVAKRFPEWKSLVEAWDELSALYEEELPSGTAPKLYARMKALANG